MHSKVVAIVSGGSSGLGAATVRYLVRNGAKCVVADLPSSIEQFEELRSSAADSDGSIQFSPTDVTSEADVAQALDAAESKFGEQGGSVRSDWLAFVEIS